MDSILQTTQLFVGERDLIVQARCRKQKETEFRTFQFFLVSLTDRTLCLTTDEIWPVDRFVYLKFLTGSGLAGTSSISFQLKVWRKVSLLGGLYNYRLEMVGVTGEKKAELESLLEPLESLGGRIYYHYHCSNKDNCTLQLQSRVMKLQSVSCGELSFVSEYPLLTGELLDGKVQLDNTEFRCSLKVEEVNQKENSLFLNRCTIRSFSDGQDKDLRILLERRAHKVKVLVA